MKLIKYFLNHNCFSYILLDIKIKIRETAYLIRSESTHFIKSYQNRFADLHLLFLQRRNGKLGLRVIKKKGLKLNLPLVYYIMSDSALLPPRFFLET